MQISVLEESEAGKTSISDAAVGRLFGFACSSSRKVNDPRDRILGPEKLMLPTEAEAFLGLPGMEFWISPAACDEVSGNSDLSGSEELLPQELEEGKEEEGDRSEGFC